MHVQAAFISANLLFGVILAGSFLTPFQIAVIEIDDIVSLLWSISTDDLGRVCHDLINLKTGLSLTEWLLLKWWNRPIFIT